MRRIFNWRGTPPLAVTFLALASLSTVGCDSLLDVEDVDVTSAGNFTDETAIPALQASTVGAFVSSYEDLILYTGVLGDEWVISGTFPTRIEVDQRDIDPGNATLGELFPDVSRARALADFAARRLAVIDTADAYGAAQAEIQSLSGLSLVIMTEAYCEGTPMSQLISVDGADKFEYGPPLTRAAVLDSAIVRLEAALAAAPAGTDGEYLARVSLGRALMNQGQGSYAEAANVVATVPTDFVYQADHSAESGQSNQVWNFNANLERWSVANNEGTNGLPFRDAMDPRMLWNRTGGIDVGFDRGTPSYNALKYPDRPAFTPIADGVEARLIEAEAALAAPDPGRMIEILNDLRGQVGALMRIHNYDYPPQLAITGFDATLPDLTLPATTAEQVDLLFQERAYWLWMTAHRLGDLRRLVRQYGRAQENVFPVGLYEPNGNAKGGSYGTDVNFPLPVEEANNPQTPGDPLGQCLNRDA